MWWCVRTCTCGRSIHYWRVTARTVSAVPWYTQHSTRIRWPLWSQRPCTDTRASRRQRYTVYAYFTIIFGISRLRDPVTAGCTARFIRISKHVAADYDASRWLTRDDAESQRRGAHTRICCYTLSRFAKLRSTTFENNVICPGNNEIWMRNWKITFQTKVTSK